jgi:hypothetical protein
MLLVKGFFGLTKWICERNWSERLGRAVIVVLVLGVLVMRIPPHLGAIWPIVRVRRSPYINLLSPGSGETVHNAYPCIWASFETFPGYEMRLLVNERDVTSSIDSLSDKSLEYLCFDYPIPHNYEVRLSFLRSGHECVVETARFRTVFSDDFCSGAANWKSDEGWLFEYGYLEGSASDGQASSIEFQNYVRGDVGLQFDAKIMPGHTGGIGAFINSFYGVVIGDRDDRTIRIYRDKKLLGTYVLPAPLLTDNIYTIVVERINRLSGLQNSTEVAEIRVFIDGKLEASAIDASPLDYQYPTLGLRVWNSKIQIRNLTVYRPRKE